MTNATITAEHIGPIEHLTIPIDPEGGVTVLKGHNGAGKDTAIEAITRALGGENGLERSDGSTKGVIEVLGVKVTVGKSTRTTGECEAVSLAGMFDLSEFVEPPVKDPEAADAKRIKAILRIRGVGPDASRFDSLGWTAAHRATILARSDIEHAPDLVEQARRIKAAVEEVARERETEAAEFDGAASACQRVAEAVDLDGETDREKLQEEWEAAFANQNILTERRNAADDRRKAVATAEAALTEAKASYTGPGHKEAQQESLALSGARSKAYDEMMRLREQLEAASVEFDKADVAWMMAERAVCTAKNHEQLITGWQATIDADRPTPVSDDDMNAAVQAVATAREAIDQGARIRDAHQKADEAQRHTEEATEARDEAKRLRKAAQATDNVLSTAVASETIRIESGRMMAEHERRGMCLFSDLSKGEAWKLAILEAVKRIRELKAEGIALIPIPQHAWEGLDPDNRAIIVKVAREEKVNIVTAECTRGDLRAERESGESAA